MSKTNWKLMLAGVLVTCVFGGIALRLAWATPAAGLTTTILSGPTLLGEIHLNSESDINDVKIKTKGLSDVYVVYNKIAPGGNTGWHSHPGPSIISVKSGTATEYHGDDPFTSIVHFAGTAFVDDGEGAHIIVNEGTTDLEHRFPDSSARRSAEDRRTSARALGTFELIANKRPVRPNRPVSSSPARHRPGAWSARGLRCLTHISQINFARENKSCHSTVGCRTSNPAWRGAEPNARPSAVTRGRIRLVPQCID